MCVIAAGVGTAVAGSVAGGVVNDVIGGGGNSSSGGASAAANAADPFASQRAQYQQQLSTLINNPGSITSQPGYQFGLQQSNNAVAGSQAAQGMVNSGNVLQAIATNSQAYAGTALNNQELLLAQLSGANVGSPGEAGSILQGQNQTNQQASSTLGSQIGGAVTSGFNNLYSQGATVNGSYASGENSTSVNSDNSGVYYDNGIN